MSAEEIRKENSELNENTMSKVSGGCALWGLIGPHDLNMIDSYPVTLADGTRYFFLKYQCRQCDKIFYYRKTGASGKKEGISESEYNSNKARADVF